MQKEEPLADIWSVYCELQTSDVHLSEALKKMQCATEFRGFI